MSTDYDPRELIAATKIAILATIKSSGMPQLSPITSVYDQEADTIYVSMTEGRAKTANLRRDPRAAVEYTSPDGFTWATAEGEVTLIGPGADVAAPEVDALVDYYRLGAGEHPDWAEYRQVMVDERRVLMALKVSHVYGAKAALAGQTHEDFGYHQLLPTDPVNDRLTTMVDYSSTALSIDISPAVTATQNAAFNEASIQADRLIDNAPLPGTPEWEQFAATGAAADREQAVALVQLRIELAAGVDPLGTVIGLRRTGVTWARIADAAGSSRQAAHTRWSAQVLAVLDRYRTGELGGPVADDESDLSR